jgi:hypothetical protein
MGGGNRIVADAQGLRFSHGFWAASFCPRYFRPHYFEVFDRNGKSNRGGFFRLNGEETTATSPAAGNHNRSNSFCRIVRNLPGRHARGHASGPCQTVLMPATFTGTAIEPKGFSKKVTHFLFSANHAKAAGGVMSLICHGFTPRPQVGP